jgi:hypothetical protein
MNKNIYHRYLKLPFEHHFPKCFENKPEKMAGATYHEFYIKKEHWDQRFVDWLSQFNLKPSNICEGFYNTPNGGGLPMHNDTNTLNNCVNINFTWGPSTSYTRWWKIKEESLLIREPYNVEYSKECLKGIEVDMPVSNFFNAKEKDCDLMYEKVIDRPSLMNVGQLHSTFNPHPTECRWTMSYHILDKQNNRHIEFDEAISLFKDLAYENHE